MKLQVLILEDDLITSRDLTEVLTQNGMEVLGVAQSAEKARSLFLSQKPDVILVDIKLKGEEDGISFVKDFNSHHIPVVYLSANSDAETLKKAYATTPSSFLTKPFDEKDLIIAIELAFNKHLAQTYQEKKSVPSSSGGFIFLKTGNKFEKIELEKILYLEADGSYTKVYTKEKFHLSAKNLSYFSEHLGEDKFIRVHRSYAVNLNCISKIDSKHVFIDSKAIPIGRAYKENLNELSDYFI